MKDYIERFKNGYKKLGFNFHEFLNKNLLIFLIILVTGISLLVRYMVCLYPTNDVVGYVFNWMNNIQKVGFNKFYTVDADYSPLFMFIISIFTCLPKGELISINGYSFYANWMYYLKTIYFIMDILIAVGVYLIIKEITKDKLKASLGYMIFLCLPVQLTNSAIWGNSDSMYFCCFIYAIYFVLKRKDYLVWLMFGISLALKLQSVFILPFLFYLVLSRRLKLYPIFMAFVGLMATFLPSYCCGASFTQPFTYFSKQVNGYSYLTLGCANIWKFFNVYNGDSKSNVLNKASTLIGLLFIGLFTAILYIRKIKLTQENIVYIATFLIGIVPFFLPHMHERYFYSLDVLILVYCFIKNKKYFFIILMQISSGIAYYHYLTGNYIINSFGEDSVTIAAVINLFLLSYIFIDLFKLDHYSKEEYKELLNKEKTEFLNSIENKSDNNLAAK